MNNCSSSVSASGAATRWRSIFTIEAASGHGIHTAQPFVAKQRPRVVPDGSGTENWVPRIDLHERLLTDPDWEQRATMMLQDVYLGIEPEIKRGQVKYIAVMEPPP